MLVLFLLFITLTNVLVVVVARLQAEPNRRRPLRRHCDTRVDAHCIG